MPNRQTNLDLKKVRIAARKNELHLWVHDFLIAGGKNKGFAKGILQRHAEGQLHWIGPVMFPLKELVRCCGPEKNIEYPEPEKKFERRVKAMVRSLEKGWLPPVLIVNPRPWPTLTVRDGNHRHEALLRSGKKKYWQIIWFKDAKEKNLFVRKYKV